MPLQLEIGHYTESGPRGINEDRFGVVTPSGSALACKGMLFAVADGVGGSLGGREAAHYAIRGLMTDYFATPDTWPVSRALNQVLSAVNTWIHGQGHKRSDLAGMACTLSALVLKGTRYHLAHVGDSRVYRLRGNRLDQLSNDHVWDRPDMHHVLTRAMGLDDHLVLDLAEGDMACGDRFLLLTDGVWASLGNEKIHALCLLHQDSGSLARGLVQAAFQAGGRDNATALVMRVLDLPPPGFDDHHDGARTLPIPPALKPGQMLDDFLMEKILHKGKMAWLYKATDLQTRHSVVIKAPNPLQGDDQSLHEGFLREEWLGRRLISEHTMEVLPISSGRRSALYYVMPYYTGTNLAERLQAGQHFTIAQVLDIGQQLLQGVATLHRLEILHRDIKPDNILLGSSGTIRLLDMGVAYSFHFAGIREGGQPGTPSYMAPELFAGQAASPASDLYAVGVTLYHLLTRRYPYGEIEPFQNPQFRDLVPPSRYRPDIPDWLDTLLRKACAREARHRFETAEEFKLQLEKKEGAMARIPATPYLERDPVGFWRGLSLILLMVVFFLAYLLVVKS